MKSIFLAGALLLAALTSKTFAADGKITLWVQQAFKTSFENASGAHWSVVNRVYRVEFMRGGEKAIAFFNGDGTLLATGRYITLENLPEELMHNLVRNTVSGSILELFEVKSSDNNIDYYATIHQGAGEVVLKSVVNGWAIYKKK